MRHTPPMCALPLHGSAACGGLAGAAIGLSLSLPSAAMSRINLSRGRWR